jgi:hypothetical protein
MEEAQQTNWGSLHIAEMRGRSLREATKEEEQRPPRFELAHPERGPLIVPMPGGLKVPVLLTQAPDDKTILTIPEDEKRDSYFTFDTPDKSTTPALGDKLRTTTMVKITPTEAHNKELSEAGYKIVHLGDLALDENTREAYNKYCESLLNTQLKREIAEKESRKTKKSTKNNSIQSNRTIHGDPFWHQSWYN